MIHSTKTYRKSRNIKTAPYQRGGAHKEDTENERKDYERPERF